MAQIGSLAKSTCFHLRWKEPAMSHCTLWAAPATTFRQDTFWCCFFIQLISLAPMASNDKMETSPPPPMELLQAELPPEEVDYAYGLELTENFPHLQPLFVTRREPSPNWIALAISFALRQLVHGQWVGLGFLSRAKSLWTPSRNFM